ncbi:MAG: hypothetical protein LBK70_00760 [Clostridiales bacterium]|jgi:N-acetylglucosamine kinase-like BadF-type ATPase|nr:hypothetical protein [Clostridiales bacterium]
MRHYIGIDGGGTNSRLLCVDEHQKQIGDIVYGGGTNIASNSCDYVKDNLHRLLDGFYAKTSLSRQDCLGVCIGSAGVDSSMHVKMMQKSIRGLGYECKIVVVNDGLLPLANYVDKGKLGIVLISGTGSIAYGMDKMGNTIRVGGWGHILDDGGSGYWIAIQALHCAFCAYDGRGKPTVLTDMLLSHFGIQDLADCIGTVYGEYSKDKSKVAQLSRLVMQGALQGDTICNDILVQAAKQLSILATSLLRRLNTQDANVVVNGGNILGNYILMDNFVKTIQESYPAVNVIKAQKDPVWGAIALLQYQQG